MVGLSDLSVGDTVIAESEDGERWVWYPDMLDEAVESNDFEPAGLDELSRLIFGNKGVKT